MFERDTHGFRQLATLSLPSQVDPLPHFQGRLGGQGSSARLPALSDRLKVLAHAELCAVRKLLEGSVMSYCRSQKYRNSPKSGNAHTTLPHQILNFTMYL